MSARPVDAFHVFVSELLRPLGEVRIRRMFGGAGVWMGDVMFALLAGEEVYLKVDEALRAELAALGSGPFLYQRKGRSAPVDLGYMRLPSSAMDDPEEASAWGARALAAARTLKDERRTRPRSRRSGGRRQGWQDPDAGC